MADASHVYAIRAIAVDAVTWMPVTTPINCNTWSVRADADIYLRTDQDDAATEDTLRAGIQDMVVVPGQGGAKYASGTTFVYVRAVTGSATVRAQFAL